MNPPPVPCNLLTAYKLLRYRRCGDAYVAVEWVHGGKTIDPAPEPVAPPSRTIGEERVSVAPQSSRSFALGAGEDPDYSVCPDWFKASEETRTLFRELKTLVDQLDRVRTGPVKTGISFKCTAVPGDHAPVLGHFYLTVRTGIPVIILEKLVRYMPLEGSFTRPNDGGKYPSIVIRDREQIRRAKPLLHAAYDSLSRSTS